MLNQGRATALGPNHRVPRKKAHRGLPADHNQIAGRLGWRHPLRSGWRGLLTGLILTCLTIFVAFDSTKRSILLPIEVLGEDGTTASTVVALQAEQAKSVYSLWLETNGLRYSNQGSVQVNAGAWIPLNNDTVAVAEPGRSYGGIGGGFATLRMILLLPKGTVVAGTNTICFRFNHTDGLASGYRVLAWNFLTIEGSDVLSPDEFAEDAPETWSPPLPDAASILAGRDLWQSASLTASNLRNSPRIQAHCADCHTQDGRDLKYFNYSNVSIVVRSRFHGLSTLQGEQIASYIRNLRFPNPGRPWNPPYQPGPGLDEQPVSNWAAGAGLSWALDQDTDALPYLLGQRGAQMSRTAAHPTPASSVAELVGHVTPEIFRPDGNLNPRQIPIALELPDWNQWLPHVHPKDAWGAAFTQSKFGESYAGLTYPQSEGTTGREPTLRKLLAATQRSDSRLGPAVAAFAQWSKARRTFLKRVVKPRIAWSQSLTEKVYSTQLWQLVKTWEMTQEFGLEGRGRDLFGLTAADSRMWFNTIPGDTAPSVARIPDGAAGVGGSALTNAYFTASWYELQILLNSGNHRHWDRSPVDWVYVIGSFHDLHVQTQQPEPVRLLVAVIKGLQSTDPRVGPEDLRRGWRPEQNVDPRIMVSSAWAPIFKPLPIEVHRAVTAALLSAWMDKNLQYPIAEYLPLGLPPQAYRSRTYGDISGGEAWGAARQFSDAGVPGELVDRLQRWGAAFTDRAARIQYEGRSSSGIR
jgi:hypothetical protein